MSVFVAIFIGLCVLTLNSKVDLLRDVSYPKFRADVTKSQHHSNSTLFVYVYGMDRGKYWPLMQRELTPYGDTLEFEYPNPLISNDDPEDISVRIAHQISLAFKERSYDRVVLIGQSMGALLIKRVFLEAESTNEPWTSAVKRIVLVAGMNRGWDISGKKPSDMTLWTRLKIWFGAWGGRLLGIGGLLLSAETGAPFVANVRVDWIKRMANPAKRKIEIVQLLGDIDDLVSADDNKDLQAVGRENFVWIKVRGTGHPNIVDFSDQRKAGGITLGEYRRGKFKLATTETDFRKLAQSNEVLPSQPDENVTDIVFVVHGIRDLGEWAAGFEHELQKKHSALLLKAKNLSPRRKLTVVSARYGYFGMGPFLLKPVREKYVKWFMDEYTETRAKFPNAKRLHFIGHSNGTYLLASALTQYTSLHFDRIVLGGSVVQTSYDWEEQLQNRAVSASLEQPNHIPRVLNYVASDDWVVALFPRFFERWPMTLLKNDIGSAGFNGFDSNTNQVRNIEGLTGGHSAFLNLMPDIASYVLEGEVHENEPENRRTYPTATTKVFSHISKWGSSWATWVIVWPALIAITFLVGWHVIAAAPEPRWPIFLAYSALLLMILRHV